MSNIGLIWTKDVNSYESVISNESFANSTISTRLKSVGKNLFDGKYESGTLSSADGYEVPNSINSRNVGYIRVEPNTNYILNFASRIYFYDSNFNFIFSTTTQPYITPNNTRYIRFNGANEIFEAGNIQLEKGTTATPYEPYTESDVYVTLPDGEELRSLPNGTNDEIRVADKVIKQNIKPLTVQSSNIVSVTSVTGATIVMTQEFADYIGGASSYTGNYTAEGYTELDNVGAVDFASNIGKSYNGLDSKAIRFILPSGITLEQARTTLTGVALSYQLATPYEIHENRGNITINQILPNGIQTFSGTSDEVIGDTVIKRVADDGLSLLGVEETYENVDVGFRIDGVLVSFGVGTDVQVITDGGTTPITTITLPISIAAYRDNMFNQIVNLNKFMYDMASMNLDQEERITNLELGI